MNYLVLFPTTVMLASLASHALAQDTPAEPMPAAPVAARPAAAATAPTMIYRHVLPDGRIVYSDEAVAGAKIDHTIRMAPAIEGNLWTTEPGTRPVVPAQTTPTPVKRIPVARAKPTPSGAVAVSDRALAEVMRAEMLLEDAKKRQAAGVKPLQTELRDNSDGGPATSSAYVSRQRSLARDVAYAEDELRKAKEALAGGR